MGCSISDFDVEGPWVRDTIHGRKVEMAFAHYKHRPTMKVTIYKVDRRFQGAMQSQDMDLVRASVRTDFAPEKLAEEERRRAEVEAESRIGNRLMWMPTEVMAALNAAQDALSDECASSAQRADALAKVRALIAKINGHS